MQCPRDQSDQESGSSQSTTTSPLLLRLPSPSLPLPGAASAERSESKEHPTFKGRSISETPRLSPLFDSYCLEDIWSQCGVPSPRPESTASKTETSSSGEVATMLLTFRQTTRPPRKGRRRETTLDRRLGARQGRRPRTNRPSNPAPALYID